MTTIIIVFDLLIFTLRLMIYTKCIFFYTTYTKIYTKIIFFIKVYKDL